MTITSEGLVDLIVGLLKAQADATGGLADVPSDNIFGIRAWPTQDGQTPQLQFALPEEEKRSLGRSGPAQFTVLATLPLMVTVSVDGEELDGGAGAARTQLAAVERAIERAVIGHPELMKRVQQIAFVRRQGRVNADGQEIVGQRVIMFGLEFFQGPEDFYVEDYEALERVEVTVDTLDPFDPAGTYGSPPFPDAVKPAPRASGPDGRAEGRLRIDLPT